MAKKKEDKFVKQEEQLQEVNNALTGAGLWIEKHSKALVWGVTIIVVVILGVMLYHQLIVEPRHKAAAKANEDNYAMLMEYYQRAAMGATTQEDAEFINGLYEEAVSGFAATADKYDNQEGKMAALYAGTTYFQAGQFEDAVVYLAKFESDDLNFNAVAKQLLGDAYVELGDYEAAIGAYWAAAGTGNEVFAPMSLKKAGIAALKMEDKEGAYNAFSAIKNNYPSSAEAQDIDKYIAYTAE